MNRNNNFKQRFIFYYKILSVTTAVSVSYIHFYINNMWVYFTLRYIGVLYMEYRNEIHLFVQKIIHNTSEWL